MADPSTGPACPSCGSSLLISHGRRNALYPIGCVFVLALPFAMLHKQSSPMEYECRACGVRFAKRSRFARFILALLITLLTALVLIYGYRHWPR